MVFPKIFEYYVSERDINSFKNIVINQELYVDQDYLLITIPYSPISHNILKTIMSKMEQVSIGDQSIYQYEFDLGSDNKSRIFIIKTNSFEKRIILDEVHYIDGVICIKFQEVKNK